MNRTIRWVCNACGRKWIQPVENCVYCRHETEKQVGRKLKVIGITKVSIPSIMHPIVPYNILLLEDEYGNKMPKKTMKEYNIGDEYSVAPSDDKHAVSITKVKYDVYEAIDEALFLIGGIEVHSNTKVLIKPNIMASAYPYLGGVTNPRIVEALLMYLFDKGAMPENVAIAEQCVFNPMEDALARTGYGELCAKHKVKFVDIDKTEFEEKSFGEVSANVSTVLKDYDLVINMPVLKTHLLFGISGAMENMTRLVSKENLVQLQMANIDLNVPMVLMNKNLPKYLTIGDGLIGMQGNGPLNGEPAFLNYILASWDPVAHDSVFAYLGMLVRKPKFLDIAEKEGLGIADVKRISVVGNDIDAVARELKPAIGSKLLKGI